MRQKNQTPSLKQLKSILTRTASDPRKPPFNVIAETATPAYLVENAVILLRQIVAGEATLVTNAEVVIRQLALAIVKTENAPPDPE